MGLYGLAGDMCSLTAFMSPVVSTDSDSACIPVWPRVMRVHVLYRKSIVGTCVWGQSLLFPLHDKYRALQTEHFPSFAFQNKRPIYIGLQSIIVELEYVQTIVEQVTRYNSPYWCNTIFPLVALLEFFVSVATCEHLFLHQQPHYMMLYPIVKFL